MPEGTQNENIEDDQHPLAADRQQDVNAERLHEDKIRQAIITQGKIDNSLKNLRRISKENTLYIVRELEVRAAFFGQKLVSITDRQAQENIANLLDRYKELEDSIDEARFALEDTIYESAAEGGDRDAAAAREDMALYDPQHEAEKMDLSLVVDSIERINQEQARVVAGLKKLRKNLKNLNEQEPVEATAAAIDRYLQQIMAVLVEWEEHALALRQEQENIVDIVAQGLETLIAREQIFGLEFAFANLAAAVEAWYMPASPEDMEEDYEEDSDIQIMNEQPNALEQNYLSLKELGAMLHEEIISRITAIGIEVAQLQHILNQMQPGEADFEHMQTRIQVLIQEYRHLEANVAEYHAWLNGHSEPALEQEQHDEAAALELIPEGWHIEQGPEAAEGENAVASEINVTVAGAIICEAQHEDNTPMNVTNS